MKVELTLIGCMDKVSLGSQRSEEALFTLDTPGCRCLTFEATALVSEFSPQLITIPTIKLPFSLNLEQTRYCRCAEHGAVLLRVHLLLSTGV